MSEQRRAAGHRRAGPARYAGSPDGDPTPARPRMTAGTATTDRPDWLELRPRPRRRRWRDKFRDAFRGIKRGVRGHSSFVVHFFFAALALAAGLVLGCALWEWCVLLGCIGLVLTA